MTEIVAQFIWVLFLLALAFAGFATVVYAPCEWFDYTTIKDVPTRCISRYVR